MVTGSSSGWKELGYLHSSSSREMTSDESITAVVLNLNPDLRFRVYLPTPLHNSLGNCLIGNVSSGKRATVEAMCWLKLSAAVSSPTWA